MQLCWSETLFLVLIKIKKFAVTHVFQMCYNSKLKLKPCCFDKCGLMNCEVYLIYTYIYIYIYIRVCVCVCVCMIVELYVWGRGGGGGQNTLPRVKSDIQQS